jgi:MFS family permease
VEVSGSYGVFFTGVRTLKLIVSALGAGLARPMVSLGILLAVQQDKSSYVQSALALTSYTIAYAIGLPLTSRFVDRWHPRRVLIVCLTFYLLADAILVVVLVQKGALLSGDVITWTAILGLSTPPASSLNRASWRLAVHPSRLQAAFSLNAVINEASLIVGPLLVSLFTAIALPVLAIALAGPCMVVAVVPLLDYDRSEGSTDSPPRESLRARLLGPLSYSSVRRILLVAAFDIFAYGCLLIGLTSMAAYHHHRSAVGVLVSVWSVSVLVGGLVFGLRSWPGSSRLKLVVLYAVGAVLLSASAMTRALPVFCLVLAVAGLAGGPRDVLLQLVLGDQAPARYTSEAFAWLSTSMWSTYGLGTTVGALLIAHDHGRPGAALLGAALICAICALLSLRVVPCPIRGRPRDREGHLRREAHSGRYVTMRVRSRAVA